MTTRADPGHHPRLRWTYLVERNFRTMRQSWLIILSGAAEPILYLLCFGLSIHQLVGNVATGGVQVPYGEFVAPALMAGAAMNGALTDSATNVFMKLQYARLYDIILATPLSTTNVAQGEIVWALLRGQLYAVTFFIAALALGLVHSWWALLCLPAAALVGLAFGALGIAGATWMRSWTDFDLVQLVTLPLFLFSGTFFPVSSYPSPLRELVTISPLYHANTMLRSMWTGHLSIDVVWSSAYLVGLAVVGFAIANRRLHARLLP